MQKGEKGLFSETTFPSENVRVEKIEISLFKDQFREERVKSDLCFVGELCNFNLPMIKHSWLGAAEEDLLQLPRPHILDNLN